MADKVSKYLKEYTSWKADLKLYWPEMDKCQEMYEFYKSKKERSETDNQISLNTPFAIVESQIAKENSATQTITVIARPDGSDIGKFDQWVSSVLKDAMDDPDVAEIHGSLRKTREMWSRQLKITGNAAAEINYCYRTEMIDGEKVVIADNPYTKIRNWKTVIFNPSMSFDRSDKYYIEDSVYLSDLLENEEKVVKGKKSGIYTNLGALQMAFKDKDEVVTDEDEQFVSGDTKISRKRKPIQIVTVWEGMKMTVIAITGSNSGIIIREATDPLKLGGHNLILGMRYSVEGRPYAYGEIAAIYKPVRAQDTIVNQNIEIVNRYLRGSYILREGAIDKNLLAMVIANGGIAPGDGSGLMPVPVNQPPPGAFQQIEVLEQAIERAARFSLYNAGLSAQSTDKTKGTASGIMAIQRSNEPETESKLDDVQDMFMTPVARKYLKMIGNLMGVDEIRYGLMKGENISFVKATKGILTGKATLKDMVTVGLMTEQEYQEYTTTIDPVTGQATPIPGAEKALLFDVDWLVSVKLDNQSASDKEERNQKELSLIQLAQQMGVQLNPEKVITRLAAKQGFDDFQELMISPAEKKQMAMMAQQSPMSPPQQPPIMGNVPPTPSNQSPTSSNLPLLRTMA
jgi:hypothetical protein